MSEPVVRAIDVGYGNVKYVIVHNRGQDPYCGMFPAIAPRAGDKGIGGDALGRRNTIVVEVDGIEFEVGKDADKGQGAGHGRIMDTEYALSPEYMAMVKGALHMMGVDYLDVLVLGLPVSVFKDEAKRAKIAQKYTGKIKMPEGKTIEIDEVKVVAQPVGGFMHYAVKNGLFRQMSNEYTLIIDPGTYSLDWLVTEGIIPSEKRSNAANNGGMFSVISAIAEEIGRTHKFPVEPRQFFRLDDAVRNNGVFKLRGEPVDLSKFIEHGKRAAAESVAKLATSVGGDGDIDNIIMVGGGAEFFMDAVKDKYPGRKILINDDPVYSNVRGFQLIGANHARNKTAKRELSAA